jgi:lipoyl synthase
MVGLGETADQVRRTLGDLRAAGTDIVTIGQYLQPTRRNLPVVEYITPERFAEYEDCARNLGFRAVVAGPLVRSSYHADEVSTEMGDPVVPAQNEF